MTEAGAGIVPRAGPARRPASGRPRTARAVALGLALMALLLSAIYPVRQYLAQRAHLRDLVAQERALDAQIAELKQLEQRLRTDDEIERIAREELGMVRPGEVAFVIVPGPEAEAAPKPGPAPPPAAPARPAPPAPAWYERWWSAFVDSLRAVR